jgi:hypothetical protein
MLWAPGNAAGTAPYETALRTLIEALTTTPDGEGAATARIWLIVLTAAAG